ncbi:ELWxxDGT repeat protein [Corallococcus terminator]
MRPSGALWGALWVLAGSCSPVMSEGGVPVERNSPVLESRLQSRPDSWPAYPVRDIGEVPLEFQERRAMPWTYTYPAYATEVMLFAAARSPYGKELWVSDGSREGTRVMKDIAVGPDSAYLGDVTILGRNLLFLAGDGPYFSGGIASDMALWKTDGTAAGTVRVKELLTGEEYGSWAVFPGFGFDDQALLVVNRSQGQGELWATDGTPEGSHLLTDSSGSANRVLFGSSSFELAGVRYVTATQVGMPRRRLWRTDFTPAGTSLALHGETPYGMQTFVPVGQYAYMFASDPTHGHELWRTDGTDTGTTLVKDIYPGPLNGIPNWQYTGMPASSSMARIDGTLYFTGVDQEENVELWKSDGTEAGTVLVKDICPGTTGSYLHSFRNMNGILYFVATSGYVTIPGPTEDDPPTTLWDTELWRSDGTTAGTYRVKDINPGPRRGVVGGLTVVGPHLYFQGRTPEHGVELWTSDGTEEGTFMVKDAAPGPLDSMAEVAGWDDGRIYFYADVDGSDRTHSGTWLWVTDGTPGGAVPVKHVTAASTPSHPQHLTDVDGTLVFWAQEGTPDTFRLWKSQGARSGTVRISDLDPGGKVTSEQRFALTAFRGRVYFTARDGAAWTIWSSGLTQGSQTRVTGGELVGAPVALGEWLYFLASADGAVALWRVGAAGTGAERVAELGTASGKRFGPLGTFGGSLVFGVGAGLQSTLWKSDGTPAGTGPLRAIHALGDMPAFSFVESNGSLYFLASSTTANVRSLWRSDGTAEGTAPVTSFNTLSDISRPALSLIGGRLVAHVEGRIWASDGTAAGTVAISPSGLTVSGERPVVAGTLAYFTAKDDTTGWELWKTDGTVAGTTLVMDVQPGPTGSNPEQLRALGNRLVFSASDGVSGFEPWTTDGTLAGTHRLADVQPGDPGSTPRSFMPAGDHLYFTADLDERGRELWAVGPEHFDTVPPSITCPADVVVDAGGRARRYVEFGMAEAWDDVSEVEVTSLPRSVTRFTVGTTPVVFTARDGAGNTATCEMRVTVLGPPSSEDGGTTLPDAGAHTPDSGPEATDAGEEPSDAGTVSPDAGDGPPDAGAVSSDAGDVVPDAGAVSPDAGPGGADAGHEPDITHDEPKGGGCSTSPTGLSLLWGLLFLMGGPLRRRRAARGHDAPHQPHRPTTPTGASHGRPS